MRRAPILTATGFAVCMLIAAYGCGGDAAELSKAEFVKQADVVCVDVKRQISKKLADEPRALFGKRGQSGALYGTTAEALQTEADEIGALGTPSADADQIEAIVEGARQVATTLEENEKGLPKEDLDKVMAKMAKTEQLAEAYGLKSCLLA